MAETKKEAAKVMAKAAPVKEDVKATEVKAEVKTEVKAAPKAEVKEAPKAAVKEAPKAAKKAPAKKEAAKKTPAKKAETKKAEAKKAPAKKTEVKQIVNFQFSGKSYTVDDLMKIAKDVWVYDLSGKEADFKTVELYVKPEENAVYYVINETVTGSFFI